MAGNYFNQVYSLHSYVESTLSTNSVGRVYIPVASKVLEFGFSLLSTGSGTTTTAHFLDSAGTTLATAYIAGAASTAYVRASSITEDDAVSGWGQFKLSTVAGTTAPTGLNAWAILQGAA